MNELSFANEVMQRTAESKFQSSIKSKISSISIDTPTGVSAEDLSKVFRIDLQVAKRTLQRTSQRLKRSKNVSLNRRYPSNDRMLQYRHIKEYFYMDTMFASNKSGATTRGKKCMRIFVTDKGFVFVCPLQRKGDVP